MFVHISIFLLKLTPKNFVCWSCSNWLQPIKILSLEQPWHNMCLTRCYDSHSVSYYVPEIIYKTINTVDFLITTAWVHTFYTPSFEDTFLWLVTARHRQRFLDHNLWFVNPFFLKNYHKVCDLSPLIKRCVIGWKLVLGEELMRGCKPDTQVQPTYPALHWQHSPASPRAPFLVVASSSSVDLGF